MVFNMAGMQKAIDGLAAVSASGQLDLSLAFKQPDEVKTMTPEEVQECIVKPANELLQECGSDLRLKGVKWCDVDRQAGKVYGRFMTDFSVSQGKAKGDVLQKKAYLMAPKDQTNDTMALVKASDIKFPVQFKDGSETMTFCDFMNDFGRNMSRLGYKIHTGESLKVDRMQTCVSQFPIEGAEFVPMVNTYGSEVLCVLFTPFGITAGIASGRGYNFLLADDHGTKHLLAAEPQGTLEDEKNETGKRRRDDGPGFIAEGVGEGWFFLGQFPLKVKPIYPGVTRSICQSPRSLVECRIKKGPEASRKTLGSALKDLPLHGLEINTSVPSRGDFFKVWHIDGNQGALSMEDVQKMLLAQQGMYESLNASPHTREKLQNLGVIGFSAMTPAQIEFLKGLGCSTDTMTLSEQMEGYELIKDLDQLFEAFTIFKIMTKHGDFARKILEIHAENKNLALDLGKELLKLLADDPDTVEKKFVEVLESKNC